MIFSYNNAIFLRVYVTIAPIVDRYSVKPIVYKYLCIYIYTNDKNLHLTCPKTKIILIHVENDNTISYTHESER